MHKLKDIKEKMIEKIEDTYKDHPSLEPAVLQYIDTLAHAAKNIVKICEAEEEEKEYSSRGGSNRSMRGFPMVFDGRSYEGGSNAYEGSNAGGSYEGSYGGEAYARGRRNARRDSMGRYSREEGYSRGTWDTVDKIEDLIREAPDEQTRQELQRIAGRMRNS